MSLLLSGRKLIERNQNSGLIDGFYLFLARVPSSAPTCLFNLCECKLHTMTPQGPLHYEVLAFPTSAPEM